MNECVSPAKNDDFPASHVSFRGVEFSPKLDSLEIEVRDETYFCWV